MEIRAHLRFLRVAPRKVRLVIDLVRGQHVDRAAEQLTILPKAAALPVKKLIDSAVANAQHNFKLDRQHLYIKSIVANDGPKMKRYRPRAFGRAAEILKRMSHVTVILEDRPATAKKISTSAKGQTVPSVPRDLIKGEPSEPKTKKPARRQSPRPDPERQRHATDITTPRRGES